ncbi:hypothetical protein M408DRAFT_327590, partial [Serendipita vermifera MAFF 305830]
ATRPESPEPDVIAHNAAKYTLVTGAPSIRTASPPAEQSSPVKENKKKTTTKDKAGKATPEPVDRQENGTKRSSRQNLAVALRSSSKNEAPAENATVLWKENKRLTEENTLLKAEVEYWRAKAKERHAKCVKLKAIIKAVQDNVDGPSDEEMSGDENPKLPKLLHDSVNSVTKKKKEKEPDFSKATVTFWDESEVPKSRFDESARARLVLLPGQNQPLTSLSLTQSNRRTDPLILPSPLKGNALKTGSGSPSKITSPIKYPHPLGRSVSPTKAQPSPTKPRWN